MKRYKYKYKYKYKNLREVAQMNKKVYVKAKANIKNINSLSKERYEGYEERKLIKLDYYWIFYWIIPWIVSIIVYNGIPMIISSIISQINYGITPISCIIQQIIYGITPMPLSFYFIYYIIYSIIYIFLEKIGFSNMLENLVILKILKLLGIYQ